MSKKEVVPKCPAVLINEKGSFECEHSQGHALGKKERPEGIKYYQKHSHVDVGTWTDEGAARMLRELKESLD